MLVTANIFQPLIDVFESVLKFFHNSVGVAWGWSIVLLTICDPGAAVPLTLKQFHSMQTLQRLQPELKEIQTKYKDDKQRQQQEMMKFYKENNVNPLAPACRWSRSCRCSSRCSTCCARDLRGDICPADPARITSCTASA